MTAPCPFLAAEQGHRGETVNTLITAAVHRLMTTPAGPGRIPTVDADTQIRGKSRAAVKAERSHRDGPFDEHGVDRNGRYNPDTDGRWGG